MATQNPTQRALRRRQQEVAGLSGDVPAGRRFELVYDHRRGCEGKDGASMRSYTAIIGRCPDTGLFVGYVPGLPGAHSQGETIDELNANLAEVIEMLLEDGEPAMESEFIGTQTVQVG
jgi:predicted RNase H-like HicB family nuclease